MQKKSKNNSGLYLEIESIIKNTFERNLYRTNHYSGADFYRELIETINSANRTRSQEDQLPIPHISTIYARIKKFQSDRVLKRRVYKKTKETNSKNNNTQVEQSFIEMVVDDTFVDLCLLDKKGGVLTGNITFTMLLDNQMNYPLNVKFQNDPPQISS